MFEVAVFDADASLGPSWGASPVSDCRNASNSHPTHFGDHQPGGFGGEPHKLAQRLLVFPCLELDSAGAPGAGRRSEDALP